MASLIENPTLKIPSNIRTTSWTHDFFPLFIYNSIRYLKPDLCVELGTYAGFSAYCIASALVDNMRGVLICYDLWDEYPFNHCNKQECAMNLAGMPVELRQKNALEVHDDFKDNSVDFLMVDISNNGEIYEQILNSWYDKLKSKGTILLEGGCKDRDEVEWMKKYNKRPIQPVLKEDNILARYGLINLGCFPSITIAQKKI